MRIVSHKFYAVALLLLVASGAWGAVTVSWTDAAFPYTHVVNLVNIDNPNYDPSDPLNIEDPYVWFGVCNVAMAQAPIQFNVVGNFWGGENAYDIWPQIRIEQHVTNLTGCNWDEFHIDVVDDSGDVYVNAMHEQNWSYVSDLSYIWFTADAPAYYIHPGEVFDDTQHFYTFTDDEGDATMTFTKQPNCVPEVGGLAMLLSGGTGLLGYFTRKRRG